MRALRTPSGKLDTQTRLVSNEVGSADAPIIFGGGRTDPEVVQDAQAHLGSAFDLNDVLNRDDYNIDYALKSAVSKFLKNSELAHLEAIVLAYSLLVIIDGTQNIKLLSILAKNLNRKLTKENKIRIIVESLISYGAKNDIERKKAERLYSRDKRAIEYLQHSKIHPSQVSEKSKAKGEGVDRWAREMSKISPKKPRATAPSIITKQQETFFNDKGIDIYCFDRASGDIINQISADDNETTRKLMNLIMDKLKPSFDKFSSEN
ncbi:hypothetical protein [Methylobacterium sp. WL19]|uniref:hypothetical protein n=1 Tax=Methylobacterium sp. WL19 TaxID=2603896 RepID=UPI0011CCBFF6|nr:hypothetical protein [Methylobacterium sp. WL19]TXN29133.1 hypothetical protein FV220_07620 [Methylobacterium sp. WL19]